MNKSSATDKLVRETTAFRDWADMLARLKAGYIPTLNGGKAYAKLAGIVRAHGFKVYRLGRVA